MPPAPRRPRSWSVGFAVIALIAAIPCRADDGLAPARSSPEALRRATAKAPSTWAEQMYQDLSPMGAIALGLAPRPEVPRLLGSQPTGVRPFGIQEIGATDVIVHGAGDARFQSETAIAANADWTVLVAGYNDLRGFSTTPQSISGLSRSTDGGATWSEVSVGPGGAGTLPSVGGGVVAGDPDVKYDPTRDRFVYSSIYVRPSDGRQGMCVHVSNADASVWTGPVEVPASFVSATAPADKEFLDVNPVTGRILLTWTQFSNPRAIVRSYSDDGGASWSPAAILYSSSTFAPQASIPRFLPGPTDATSTAYVAWRVSPASSRNVMMSRSTDGGVTWEAAVNLLSVAYTPEDQILGVDRVNNSPSVAIDHGTGRVYVVYQSNNSLGEGDIALRTFVGAPAPGTPVLLSSNPGADRAQFFPWVTVDQGTHRVHVIWYDQDPFPSGDLTELMHTYSDDQGATWSRAAPLLDRPFRAGYGNDRSQPNIGDYNQAVAGNGYLHTVAAATSRLSHFDEGLPIGALFSPDTYYDRRADSEQVASLRLGAPAMAEVCASGANDALEPGETAAFTFPLENYVGNPILSPTTYTGISATLTSSTPGVMIQSGPQGYPDIGPLATAGNPTPFLVQLESSLAPGTYVDLLLTVQTDQGATQLPYLLATGLGGPVVLLSEDFEGAAAPALPAGWSAAVEGGATTPAWVTGAALPGGGTGSNMAFHGNTASGTLWHRLTSPLVDVPDPALPSLPYVTLDFDLAYSTEDNSPLSSVLAWDGLTLTIMDETGGLWLRSVLAEAFAERFRTGSIDGFPKHLPRGVSTNYFEDMSVWAGYSNGLVHVSMKFPGAGMVGRSVRLSFEYTQDSAADCTGAGHPGPCGVAIDNVTLAVVPTEGTFQLEPTSMVLTATPDPAPEGTPVQISASLTPADASGTVGFYADTEWIGSAQVSGGVATIETSALGVGNHSLAALYLGDACHSSASAESDVNIGPSVGVGDDPPAALSLAPIWPNPASGPMRVGFAVPREAAVELRVLDVQGRVVTTLAQATYPAGRHMLMWGGRIGPGLYFVQLRAEGRSIVRRVAVVR